MIEMGEISNGYDFVPSFLVSVPPFLVKVMNSLERKKQQLFFKVNGICFEKTFVSFILFISVAFSLVFMYHLVAYACDLFSCFLVSSLVQIVIALFMLHIVCAKYLLFFFFNFQISEIMHSSVSLSLKCVGYTDFLLPVLRHRCVTYIVYHIGLKGDSDVQIRLSSCL